MEKKKKTEEKLTAFDRGCIRDAISDAFGHLAERDSDPAVRAVLVAEWPDSMSMKYAKLLDMPFTPEFHAVAVREWARCGKTWKREEGY